MAETRLTGGALRAARAAFGAPFVARLFWSVASADFFVPELRRRPASDRAALGSAPTPVAARPPRAWTDAGLGAPPVTGGRTPGATRRAAFAAGDSPDASLTRLIAAHEAAGSRSPLVVLDVDRARRRAVESTARWRAGAPKGPLDGLIVPVKDEFDMDGLPTRGGGSFAYEPPGPDAWVVRRLEDAGAIVVGKSHATEWGMNPVGVLEHVVGPRNAHDPNRAPGGSSTGSGVAVALGWCASAVGTDGGGSVRIPASLNGVFGLKPTYVRVGRTGDRWNGNTVSHIGPLGQSALDLVEQLAATAGIDPEDPETRLAPDGHDAAPWARAIGRGVRGARIGVLRSEIADADPGVAEAVLAALTALEADGAVLVDVDVPLARLSQGMGALIIGCETAANLTDLAATRPGDLGEELRIILGLMGVVSKADLDVARRTREVLRRQVADALRGVDVLALPTTQRVAPAYLESEDRTPILDTGATGAMTRFNFLGNLTGLPAGTAPVGVTEPEARHRTSPSRPLPVGLQIVGDAWDEASVLAVLAHVERIGLSDAVSRPPGFLPSP
jgi:aspartyl-tRNA(Asn)/glutamyl-tRNA(Gln) amidotransferase subunit A